MVMLMTVLLPEVLLYTAFPRRFGWKYLLGFMNIPVINS